MLSLAIEQSTDPIRLWPDPVLHFPGRLVDEAEITELKPLIKRMKRIAIERAGLGLAAAQLGVAQQVFVFRDLDEEELRDLDREELEAKGLKVAINPQLELGPETIDGHEQCLSIGSKEYLVERARSVQMQALDEQGNPYQLEAEDLVARIIQHETDHIHGILITDRTRELILPSEILAGQAPSPLPVNGP